MFTKSNQSEGRWFKKEVVLKEEWLKLFFLKTEDEPRSSESKDEKVYAGNYY